ncbi:MAG TPA: LysE family transporter [Alphaproteobacteria bacterium]|jgi:threonine/homoserine/homoserine lactone efflux protein
MDLILLIKGAVAGFIIAAPIGPVGFLCIQRTLSKGMPVGLAAGFGGAVADTIFGAVAAFGLTFIADFLLRHDTWMRLGGGVLLLILGLHGCLRKLEAMRPAPPSVRGAAGDSVSAFILTVTNPMTILTFSPVFLAVGAVVAQDDRPAAWTLILGVFAGSCLWWLILCALAELFRRRINAARVAIIQRISAGFILLFGVVVLLSTTSLGERLIHAAKPLGF